jgi:hypothetical protein
LLADLDHVRRSPRILPDRVRWIATGDEHAPRGIHPALVSSSTCWHRIAAPFLIVAPSSSGTRPWPPPRRDSRRSCESNVPGRGSSDRRSLRERWSRTPGLRGPLGRTNERACLRNRGTARAALSLLLLGPYHNGIGGGPIAILSLPTWRPRVGFSQRSDSRSIPTSTARSVRSSSQSIRISPKDECRKRRQQGS